MIGAKKLSTIRQEIESSLAATSGDPIENLERLIAAAKHKGQNTDVLEGLKQFLETPIKRKEKPKRSATIRRRISPTRRAST